MTSADCRPERPLDNKTMEWRCRSRGMLCFRSTQPFVGFDRWLDGSTRTLDDRPTSDPSPCKQLAECLGCRRTRKLREGLGERQRREGRASRDSTGILVMKLISLRQPGDGHDNLRDSRIAPQHPKNAMTNTKAPSAMMAAGKNPG